MQPSGSQAASNNSTSYADEGTPLLQPKTKKTPVSWGQINLAFITLIAEPISSAYTFPFINQLIGELGITGGDDRRIGYYTGLIPVVRFRWSPPCHLISLTVSTIAFGLSRTLGMLIISRCIAGFLNGNLGVVKSILGDLTDHTNMAQVFTLIPAVFCVGATVAPLYGGALVKPQERWPKLFQGEFWATYPYFLPSLVSGCFTSLAFLICAMFLKESLPSKTAKRPRSDQSAIENARHDPPGNDAPPMSMSMILKTYSVMLPIANYGILALIDTGFHVLVPLFCASPIEIGGLGLPPPIIGTFLAAFRIVDGTVQALFSARLIEWLGAKRVFCSAILFIYPLLLLFPIMSAVVTVQGTVGPLIVVLLVMQIISMVLRDLCFPAIFIFVTRAAPNKQSLGSVNGLSQSLVSITRAIGPALTTSLFAFSKEYNALGGNLIYVILAMLTTILVLLSRRLPDLKYEE